MTPRLGFDLAALLFALTAALAYINYRFLRLPQSIGLVVIALVTSLSILALGRVLPGLELEQAMRDLLKQVDFAGTLINGALSFLLFAGALQIRLDDLLAWKWTILSLATFGVALSTALVGLGMWQVFGLVGLALPLSYCLTFGALISPTDPVAVLDLLRGINVPRGLQAIVAGESLFNDGIGIVLFSILLAAATTGASPDPLQAAIAFVREAGGATMLGLVTGYIAFLAIRSIDEYTLELMITLALVMVTYAVAQRLHVSGPVAVVVAGLLTGKQKRRAMSERTRGALQRFWGFVDETLNALLFLLIGFQVVSIQFNMRALAAAALAIPLVLAARFVSVALPAIPLNLNSGRKWRGIMVLTWGGLRGGISVALALSLPPGRESEALLTVCYAIVVFSIVVQGLTTRILTRRLFPEAAEG